MLGKEDVIEFHVHATRGPLWVELLFAAFIAAVVLTVILLLIRGSKRRR